MASANTIPALVPSIPGAVHAPMEKDPEHLSLPSLTSIVTHIYRHDDGTGKPQIRARGTCWDAEQQCWIESDEVVAELPSKYGPGDVLPSFDGFIRVYDDAAMAYDVYGASTLPANMVGGIICIDGEMCYTGHPPIIAPEEVQIGGEAPDMDSDVKLWVDEGLLKYKSASGWVQGIPYGA